MLVRSDPYYITEFLLHWTEHTKELEICNLASEAYLELENFEDIEFLD